MATYTGSQGIAELKAKIRRKSKLLVSESAEKLAIVMVDGSPLGVEHYNSIQGTIHNDVGDFKNSWNVGLGMPDPSSRAADSTGAGAVGSAIAKAKLYDLQDNVYVTNNVDHADMVESGWQDNPEYGWKAKDGYHPVRENIGTAKVILAAVAIKVSTL